MLARLSGALGAAWRFVRRDKKALAGSLINWPVITRISSRFDRPPTGAGQRERAVKYCAGKSTRGNATASIRSADSPACARHSATASVGKRPPSLLIRVTRSCATAAISR